MPLTPFQAVIFDCDGVLVDSEQLGLRSLQHALREAGIERSLVSLARFSGRSHKETLAQLETESGVPLLSAGIPDRMDELYMGFVAAEGLRSCPGVCQLLSRLSDCRIPFTLASSGPRRKVTFSLRSAGLLAYFPRFICGDDVVRAKPAPDLYLEAAGSIGVDPKCCLAIEDAPNGIKSARAAGMQVVAVATSFDWSTLTEADLIVESLVQFTDLWAGLSYFKSSAHCFQ